jgi:hypothetical protein
LPIAEVSVIAKQKSAVPGREDAGIHRRLDTSLDLSEGRAMLDREDNSRPELKLMGQIPRGSAPHPARGHTQAVPQTKTRTDDFRPHSLIRCVSAFAAIRSAGTSLTPVIAVYPSRVCRAVGSH